MNLRRIKHTILRLSPEEKMVGVGGLLVIFGCFMPWYSVVLNFDKKNLTQTGFGGDLGVIGFIVFLMVIIALLVLVGEHLHIRLPQFGYSKEQCLFFLMGQSAFLVLLAIAVYTKRSLDFTDAELRFGMYMSLIGAFLGAFAAFAQLQKFKTKEVERFFDHPNSSAEDDAEEEVETQYESPRRSSRVKIEEEVIAEPEEENQLFEEETEELAELELDESDNDKDSAEDDLLGGFGEEEDGASNQGGFFTKEAGIHEEEKEASKGSDKKGLPMNFYED